MFDFLKKLFAGAPPVDYKQLLHDGALILDVRTAGEFKGGHVKGSINIPLDQLAGKVSTLRQKGKPVIAVCRSGNRSAMAVDILQKAGLQAYNGGAWQSLQSRL